MQSAVKVVRRLAAIAFADIAGWTKLVEADALATGAAWKLIQRTIIQPHLPDFSGRLVEVAGDAVLVEFASAVDAVRWAVDLQRRLEERRSQESTAVPIRMRIGISIEDVIVEEDSLLGDGVNVASRVHQSAAPDEIVVTQAVRDFVWNKLPLALQDLGEQRFKNVSRPIRTFRVLSDVGGGRTSAPVQVAWENRATVAVLPFRSEGGDAAPYFGDGMTEEIIGSLSLNRSLFVIARNSTLKYRNHDSTASDIASALGVRYLLEGSVRRHKQRLRIHAVLLDAASNREIWSERYDGVDEDLFTFQDQIASSISAAIDPRVREAEISRIKGRPTDSFDAYDCVLRGLSVQYNLNRRDLEIAGEMFQRAIAIDPSYGQAHAHLAWWHNLRIGEGHSTNVGVDQQLADEFARRAVELDPGDAWSLAVCGHIQSFLKKRFRPALDLFAQALELNPSCATAWALSGLTLAYTGQGEEALARVQNALRLSPFDQLSFWFCTTNGIASIVAGRLDEAMSWLNKALRLNPRYRASTRMLIAAQALSGEIDEARQLAGEFIEGEPGFTVAGFGSWYPLQPPHLERVMEGLRLAGLPP
jgi:adenylate cyclase